MVDLGVILIEWREYSTLKCARWLLDRLRKTMKTLQLQVPGLYSTHI